uniref:Uncharacterized protein n=1 Tax=viral metagenome TaxID=1070528 RepID=A0A6C0BPK5_9ZZZZ
MFESPRDLLLSTGGLIGHIQCTWDIGEIEIQPRWGWISSPEDEIDEA